MRNNKRALTIGSEKVEIPGIEVIEGGKTIVRPDVIQAVTQLATLGQLVKIRKSLEREQFTGRLDSRTLDATSELKFLNLLEEWPHTPWINAFFMNTDGPDTAEIGINNINNTFKLRLNQTRTLDYAHADERITIIYYKCAVGETASVAVEGHY